MKSRRKVAAVTGLAVLSWGALIGASIAAGYAFGWVISTALGWTPPTL